MPSVPPSGYDVSKHSYIKKKQRLFDPPVLNPVLCKAQTLGVYRGEEFHLQEVLHHPGLAILVVVVVEQVLKHLLCSQVTASVGLGEGRG